MRNLIKDYDDYIDTKIDFAEEDDGEPIDDDMEDFDDD